MTARRPAARRVMDAEAAAIWAYRAQCVDNYGYATPDGIGSNAQAIARFAELGGRVDGGWSAGLIYGAGIASVCHPDASAIHAALMGAADGAAARLVRHYAHTGERPEWRCVPHVAAQAVDGRWHRCGRGTVFEAELVVGEDGAVWCPLHVYDGPATARLKRAEYGAWWCGLARLAAALAGGLETIDITAPAASRRPWHERSREPPAKGCKVLSASDRAALFEAARTATPAELAERFGLKPKAIRDMLYAHRRRHTKS